MRFLFESKLQIIEYQYLLGRSSVVMDLMPYPSTMFQSPCHKAG